MLRPAVAIGEAPPAPGVEEASLDDSSQESADLAVAADEGFNDQDRRALRFITL